MCSSWLRSLRSLAWVPLPLPGGPRRINRIRRPFGLRGVGALLCVRITSWIILGNRSGTCKPGKGKGSRPFLSRLPRRRSKDKRDPEDPKSSNDQRHPFALVLRVTFVLGLQPSILRKPGVISHDQVAVD